MSQYVEEDININFNDCTQLYLDIRDKEWSKQFSYGKKSPNYVYFPEVSDERVYLNFTTDIRKSRKAITWSYSLVHVIGSSEAAFDTIYAWIRHILGDASVDDYFDNEYTNRIVSSFELTRIPIIKDISTNTTVIWLTATEDLKSASCDVAIVREVTPKDKVYQCRKSKVGVYLIENMKMNSGSVDYEQPDEGLARYKWVGSSDIQPLLTEQEIEENDSYYRNAMVYFALKYNKSQNQLRNYKALDKICCIQIFKVLSKGIQLLFSEHNVGKTKRFGYIIPLHRGRYSIPRYLKNERSIQLDQWKKGGNISTLKCNSVRHASLYGIEATEKVVTIENDDGTAVVAFTLLFQFSDLKISELDNDRARIYGFCHLVKRRPNGIIIGKKVRKQRRRPNHNVEEQKNDEEEIDDEKVNDEEINVQI
eukprot:339551_1